MIVSGELENVPLLDVFQVLAFSSQSGALHIESGDTTGTVLLEQGGIVCGESPATQLLLARAAQEVDPQNRRAFRRVQALACLTELMSLRSGFFRFEKHDEPMAELAGVDMRPFYASGTMSMADLLLVLATAVDKKDSVPMSAPQDRSQARSDPRFSPTLIEAELRLGTSKLSGYLTNMSVGGAFFQGDALPEKETVPEIRFELPGGIGAIVTKARVVWARSEPTDGERGVGLAFEGSSEADKKKIQAYLERFQQLAADMDLAG
ncbi:MAG: hypothetical protein BMS9Abin37_0192 [Acidobacteriota bacterium]|nr:MAG: hypothetical protein BMS9Abin37_0192 [Acidobacteriota bacterium]